MPAPDEDRDGAPAPSDGMIRRLECYAAGFGPPCAGDDGRGNANGRAPIRVSIATGAPAGHGAGLRTSIGDDAICLAPAPAGDGFRAALFHEASLAHALAHLRYSRAATPIGTRTSLRIAIASLLEDARVERLFMREYPGLRDVWGVFHATSPEPGPPGFASLAARLARALHDPGHDDANDWVRKARALVRALDARPHDVDARQEAADILAVDLAQMRVRFESSAWRVEPPYRDDNRWLWALESEAVQARAEHEDGAREQATARPDRADTPARPDDPSRDIAGLRAYRYPEWHARIGCLLPDWTCVYDREPAAGARRDDSTRTMRTMRQSAPPMRLPQWQRPVLRLRRRPEGDELDLNALLDHGVARRMGFPGDGRIFEARRHARPPASVLLLMDCSASTGERLGPHGPTVLDIEKHAAAATAASLESTATRVALHGFASNGRHDVRYLRIKDFDEPFGDVQRTRLHGQQSAFSTRMGAALRHAAAQFDPARRDAKLLLLVTDGQPSDIDVHGPSTHLVEDARHAVQTLAAQGILPFCIAFDRDADPYLRPIFGSRRYAILGSTTNLAAQIGAVLANLR
ncbi:hypothetical protein CY652_07185 [Burkholderia sp. WAC0059]|uniref:nitric oxide reductase activation protein NorD n=1 Tax=Burkholderia sp. WAC0059 TaxID=2066022 RepID=UPI000C7F1C12|nr:VWA domain-containing protein [Burkholderia sp. WAC0059]PLZ03085.1 hypothetical protein CY652_07185 [Burkholderia sp. WAC0059]